MFKQINIENFVNIGKEHAPSIQNVNLKDTISFVRNFYKDWTNFLSTSNKSHYDATYPEFERYLFGANSFFTENFRDAVLLISVLYNHKLVQQVLASTFKFEHPDIVQKWLKSGSKRTSARKLICETLTE